MKTFFLLLLGLVVYSAGQPNEIEHEDETAVESDDTIPNELDETDDEIDDEEILDPKKKRRRPCIVVCRLVRSRRRLKCLRRCWCFRFNYRRCVRRRNCKTRKCRRRCRRSAARKCFKRSG